MVSGDKLIARKGVLGFLNEGDIAKVIDVSEDNLVSFVFGKEFQNRGMMSMSECEKYFDIVFEKESKGVWAPSVTQERIDKIISNSNITVQTVFDKCTIVACQLPNGFVIVESSACISPENYNEEMGIEICLNKITDKIWELEGYNLQNELYRDDYNYNNCEDCPCESCCDECEECENYEEDEDFDECLDTDLDCDDCEDYDCPNNTNIFKH